MLFIFKLNLLHASLHIVFTRALFFVKISQILAVGSYTRNSFDAWRFVDIKTETQKKIFFKLSNVKKFFVFDICTLNNFILSLVFLLRTFKRFFSSDETFPKPVSWLTSSLKKFLCFLCPHLILSHFSLKCFTSMPVLLTTSSFCFFYKTNLTITSIFRKSDSSSKVPRPSATPRFQRFVSHNILCFFRIQVSLLNDLIKEQQLFIDWEFIYMKMTFKHNFFFTIQHFKNLQGYGWRKYV